MGSSLPRQGHVIADPFLVPSTDSVRTMVYNGHLMTQPLPFFCRQELNLEKKTGLPIRLRAGSLSSCDWLEQKPGSIHP